MSLVSHTSFVIAPSLHYLPCRGSCYLVFILGGFIHYVVIFSMISYAYTSVHILHVFRASFTAVTEIYNLFYYSFFSPEIPINYCLFCVVFRGNHKTDNIICSNMHIFN